MTAKPLGGHLYWSLSSPHPHSADGETEAYQGTVTHPGSHNHNSIMKAPIGLAQPPLGGPEPWGPQIDGGSSEGNPPSAAQILPGTPHRGGSPSYAKKPAAAQPLFTTPTQRGALFPLRFGPPATGFPARTQQKAKKEMVQASAARRSQPGAKREAICSRPLPLIPKRFDIRQSWDWCPTQPLPSW